MNTLRSRIGALPREGRDAIFLLIAIAWIVLPLTPHLPLWCSALVAAVLAWRGRLAWRGLPLPRARWVLALLALGAVGTFASHGTLLGRDAGVTLVVVLLALKTLELRARRDAFVIFFLGFFTLVTYFFYSQSLAVAGAMLVGLMALLTALVNAHLPVGRPPLRQSAATAGRMVLLGAPVMAVLFVLFPRLTPLWGLPADALTGRSGLSAQMEVGNVARLALDESIALRVRFENDQVPPRSQLYFRGPVLGRFDGRSWRPLYPRPAILPRQLMERRAPLQLQGEPVRYRVTLEPHNRPWLLTLDVAGQAPEVADAEAIGTPELQWLLARPVTDLLRYDAQSHLQWTQGPLASAAALPWEYRELPPGSNPRTLELGAELMRQAAPQDKAALVQAALQRLRTGGYRYTLEPGLYGTDSADEFWFDRKEGFCEHIASAFVVLMRAMDIPSRIVTGYQGGERNPIDGWWVVRQSDAHAWTEVWLQGQGWVRIDPTSSVAPGRIGSFQRLQPPPGVLANTMAAVSPTLAAHLRSVWEAVNNAWNQRVLNYTQSRQLALLRQLGFESPDWKDLAALLAWVIAAAATAGGAWSLWERRRQDPWLRLLARARQRLEKSGLPLPATHGPRQLATAALAHFGADAQALADWLLRLEAQRYARSPQLPLATLRRQFDHLPWPSSHPPAQLQPRHS
ncbi:DUF3488 domain-containing transglutaminase family protein [Ramlibacter sp. AW1]|uniref:DUF3488 domain-containing transglutaminase family protein n=1 Tax=Ramlibacter aurantiacus TaxID=2801330 RepID=A0A936ZV60_9BURK|nr:DUF3488 domain-containing transglutaminase family protein [Ramlibacter aurantiacus]